MDRAPSTQCTTGGASLPLPRRQLPRWHTAGALLVTVLLLVVSAVVFRPALTAAAIHDRPTTSTLSGDRAAEVAAMIDLIEGSRAVLAINPEGDWPLSEVAIWIADTDQSGLPEVDEVAVVAHGALASTIRLYRCPSASPRNHTPLAIDIPTTGSTDGAFFRSWRRAGEVTSQIVASGLSDVQFTWLNEIDRLGRRPLQLSLRWTSESADASALDLVVINAQMGVDGEATR